MIRCPDCKKETSIITEPITVSLRIHRDSTILLYRLTSVQELRAIAGELLSECFECGYEGGLSEFIVE